MSIDHIMSMSIDTDELREELLEILAKADKPMELQALHARSEISPGRATTSAALAALRKAGQVRRILNPVNSKALYRVAEDAPASVPKPQPAQSPFPAEAASITARVHAFLSTTTQALTTRDVAVALGDEAPSRQRIKNVSNALANLSAKGLVARERQGNAPKSPCLWHWIGEAAPQTRHTPQTPPPTPAPAPIAPAPTAVPAADWLLTAAGNVVLRSGAAEIELSARQSLALHRFLNALHIHEFIELQEARA